jgi:hypothetical protein
MSSTEYREHRNYSFLIKVTRRVLRYLLGHPAHPPAVILINEVAFIVTLARSVFGKEKVDEHIQERIKRQDACDAAEAAGICNECFKEQVIPKRSICETCLREIIDEEVSDILKYKS